MSRAAKYLGSKQVISKSAHSHNQSTKWFLAAIVVKFNYSSQYGCSIPQHSSRHVAHAVGRLIGNVMRKGIARLIWNSNPHSTYYDGRLRQGPALIRARRPYLFKNAFTGLGLLAVVGGICKHHSTDDGTSSLSYD